MESLFVDSKNVNHAHKATRQKARTSIDTAMDWEKAAQLCLGLSEWKKQAKRDEFKKLLHEVVGKTAYSRLDKFWKDGTTYQFLPLEIKGNDAHVSALYSVNASQFKIEYFLTKKETKWLIYDVAYEGERYSTNINDQIEAFLRENSFSTLLDKLRKRLAELETNENKGKGKK